MNSQMRCCPQEPNLVAPGMAAYASPASPRRQQADGMLAHHATFRKALFSQNPASEPVPLLLGAVPQAIEGERKRK